LANRQTYQQTETKTEPPSSRQQFTSDSLVHVGHVGDSPSSLGAVVKVADARVEVRRRHRSERLFVYQLHGAVAIRHSDVLEQALRHGRIAVLGGHRWRRVHDRELRNGNRRR